MSDAAPSVPLRQHSHPRVFIFVFGVDVTLVFTLLDDVQRDRYDGQDYLIFCAWYCSRDGKFTCFCASLIDIAQTYTRMHGRTNVACMIHAPYETIHSIETK